MKNTLLLLHGALGSEEQFSGLKQSLENNFRVFSLNFSGHGGRILPGKFSIDLFVNDVLEFIRMHSFERINIFGYSMGGYVALKLASHHPDSIERIMTLGTKFDWNQESAQRETRLLDPEKMQNKIPGFVTHLQRIHHPNEWSSVVRLTSQMMHELGNGAAMSDDEFSSIKNEVLVSVGSEDKMVSIEESKLFSSKIRNASLSVLNAQPHAIEQVDIQLLTKEIELFMGENPV